MVVGRGLVAVAVLVLAVPGGVVADLVVPGVVVHSGGEPGGVAVQDHPAVLEDHRALHDVGQLAPATSFNV